MVRTKKHQNLPQLSELFIPVVKALIYLGGSGSIEEINERVYEITKLPEEILNIPHGTDGRTEIEYKLAWVRTILKKYGLIENSARRVWSLEQPGVDISKINPSEIEKAVRAGIKYTSLVGSQPQKDQPEFSEIDSEVAAWKEQLLEKLYSVSPASFERLTQRLLRESGFVHVDVLGKTGDGGIDGKGIVRINGFLSFHIIFQCKRYRGSVSPSQIRDFRGAMQGRADKGLFVTTGTFTREAIKEATRDGAPPIDLIDGDTLCDKLKELKLGVETEFVEVVKLKKEWFDLL